MADSKYGAEDLNWEDKRTPIQFEDFTENSKAIFYLGQKVENGESNMNPLHDISLSKFHVDVDSMMPPNNQMANSNHNFFSNSSHYNENQMNTSNIYMNNSNISLLNHGFNPHNNMTPNTHLQHHHAMQMNSANNNNHTNNLPNQGGVTGSNALSMGNLNGPYMTDFRAVRDSQVNKHLYPTGLFPNNFVELPHLLSQRDSHMKRVMPLLCNLEEEPRYVNEKQFNRMMIMRIKRAKENTLKNLNQPEKVLPDKKKKYKYESRHQHAMKRVRGKDGRFVKTIEDEESRQETMSGEKKPKEKVKESRKKIKPNNIADESSKKAKDIGPLVNVEAEKAFESKHEANDLDEQNMIVKFQDYEKEDSNREEDHQSMSGEPFDLAEDRPADLSNLISQL